MDKNKMKLLLYYIDMSRHLAKMEVSKAFLDTDSGEIKEAEEELEKLKKIIMGE